MPLGYDREIAQRTPNLSVSVNKALLGELPVEILDARDIIFSVNGKLAQSEN